MLKEYLSSLSGQKIGFIGCGVSNLPILRIMARQGIKCSVRDKKELSELGDELKELGCETHYGADYLENIDENMLFLSPAVRSDIPQLVDAARRGVKLTGELAEFFALCPCPVYTITGSDGKTTTSTLTAKLLEESGVRVHLGGNIGKNLFCSLDDIAPTDAVVAELSSFQLMKLSISPNVATVTNVAPNHLDWHTGMDEYVNAKLNICRFQHDTDKLVLNADDAYAPLFASASPAQKCYTSVKRVLDEGFSYAEGYIRRNGTPFIADGNILLPGVHNRANYCQALSAVGSLISDEAASHVAATFAGVEHRCEFIRERNGVRFYNSSIDSSPSRTAACLRSFHNRVICICGGYDKKIPFEPLAEVCKEKAKLVVLFGATADKIEAAFRNAGFTDYIRANGFQNAAELAVSAARPGDVVVLSPACASFDLFKNFEQRGNIFKEIINQL